MSHLSKSAVVSACSLALALAACGGGTSALAPAPETYDLQAAYTHLIAAGLTSNVALSGSVPINGVTAAFTGTGTLVLSPGVTGTFNGATELGQTTTISGTIMASGQSSQYSSSVTDYFDPKTYAFQGELSANEYDVVQTPFSYPTSITGGSGGVLGTVSRYTDSTMSMPIGTAQLSYTTTAAATAGGPASVQLIDKLYDNLNNLTETDTTTYSISSSNVLAFLSATVSSTSGSLTVTPK